MKYEIYQRNIILQNTSDNMDMCVWIQCPGSSLPAPLLEESQPGLAKNRQVLSVTYCLDGFLAALEDTDLFLCWFLIVIFLLLDCFKIPKAGKRTQYNNPFEDAHL